MSLHVHSTQQASRWRHPCRVAAPHPWHSRPAPYIRYSVPLFSGPTLGLAASSSPTAAAAQEPTFSLETVLDLALTHNPTVASAEGTIEQNRGQQVAAYTYLNPSISANSGRGNMRDHGAIRCGGARVGHRVQPDRRTADRVAVETRGSPTCDRSRRGERLGRTGGNPLEFGGRRQGRVLRLAPRTARADPRATKSGHRRRRGQGRADQGAPGRKSAIRSHSIRGGSAKGQPIGDQSGQSRARQSRDAGYLDGRLARALPMPSMANFTVLAPASASIF